MYKEIKKVKATKDGFLIIYTDGSTQEENSREHKDENLSKWFRNHKAEPMFSKLEKAKKSKLTQIKKAKKLYQNRSVPVDIDGTTYTFFGGKENGEKYEDALNTAVRLGMAEGTVSVEEGLITINKQNMDKALGLIGLQGYKGWRKEQHYIEAINNATSQEELDLVVWS